MKDSNFPFIIAKKSLSEREEGETFTSDEPFDSEQRASWRIL